MIDIIRSVLITGRYAELDEAQFVIVADGKGAGVGVECEQCRAKRRAEYRKFSCGNVYFHFISLGFPIIEADFVPNHETLLQKYCNILCISLL